MSRTRTTLDCVSCLKRVPIEPRTIGDTLAGRFAGEDCEASGMCDRCQSAIEEREAIIAARYERQGRILSNTALFVLAANS